MSFRSKKGAHRAVPPSCVENPITYTAKRFAYNLVLVSLVMYCLLEIIQLPYVFDQPSGTVSRENAVQKIVSACLLAPVIEEIGFRLHLSGHRAHITLSAAVALVSLLLVYGQASSTAWFVLAVLAAAGYFVTRQRLRLTASDAVTCIRSYRKYYWIPLVLSSFLFAAAHFLNDVPVFLASPENLLFLTPHFITGMILGTVRLACGMGYAVAFHAVHNALLLLPVAISLH